MGYISFVWRVLLESGFFFAEVRIIFRVVCKVGGVGEIFVGCD